MTFLGPVDSGVPHGQALGPALALLSRAPQNDRLGDTVFDEVRCGAATAVAAALINGAPSVESLIQGLRQVGARGGVGMRTQPMLRLDAIADESRRGALSPESIQRLQDYVYAAAAKDPAVGTNGYEQQRMFAMARLTTRPFELPRTGAPASRLRALRESIQPNEGVPLSVRVEGAPSNAPRHTLLYGRDPTGREFIVDSDSRRPVLTAPADHIAITQILRSVVQVHGGEVIRFN